MNAQKLNQYQILMMGSNDITFHGIFTATTAKQAVFDHYKRISNPDDPDSEVEILGNDSDTVDDMDISYDEKDDIAKWDDGSQCDYIIVATRLIPPAVLQLAQVTVINKAHAHLIAHALQLSYTISVWDGEEWQVEKSSDITKILDAVDSVDDSELRIFEGDKVVGWARIIDDGTAEETVSDHYINEWMEDWSKKYSEYVNNIKRY